MHFHEKKKKKKKKHLNWLKLKINKSEHLIPDSK